MPEEIAHRVANVLIQDVQVDTSSLLGAVVASAVPEDVLAGYRANFGGLWVGGRATLTTNDLVFAANAMNRNVQKGTLDLAVPLGAILDVGVQPSLVTNIVVIRTARSVLKVRCYRARAFAQQIREATARKRGQPA